MEIRKVFGSDKKKETDGVWIKGSDGAEFLIARVNNPNAEKLSASLMKPHRKMQRMGRLDKKIEEDIGMEVISRTILLGWKGVKEDGKDVPFTPETAKRYLVEIPDFADFIASYATDFSNFKAEEEEARQGN